MNIERMRELAEVKFTSIMQDALLAIANGKKPTSGIETMMKLVTAGLLDYKDGEYTVTPQGEKLAAEVGQKRAARREAKNRASRVRHSTLTSLGMKRTRSGAYESIEDRMRALLG